MLERQFIPKQAIEQRRAWIERSSERARLSPDQKQARREELDLVEEIFSMPKKSNGFNT